MIINKAYEFRLYPNKKQKEMFAKTFGSARFVYNHFLNLWNKEYEETKKGLSYSKCSAILPKLKSEDATSFLKEVDSIALQSSLRDLANAFSRFFKKQNNKPVFKSKLNNIQSYKTKNTNNNLYIRGNYIKLPKVGFVKLKNSHNFDSKIINVTIKLDSSGHYYASALVEEKVNPFPLTKSNVGIDIGLDDFVVLSDGTKYQNIIVPEDLRNKLTREQKRLSRMSEGAKARGVKLIDSKNYQKQKKKVARIYKKIRNIVSDYTNKLSTELIKNHDLLCIESLNVEHMLKNKYLSKSISEASISNFMRKLEYKARWYGKKLVKVDTYYPSTQTCSSCGHVDGKKALHIRSWKCSKCNASLDRDINASINILNEGLRILSQT
ncbi:MAG TPA: IS200/IS605 family element RNA-guided endonuclease TnpB [Bacilli bacterium]|nr:IS200/IS605 family element RNA-guided endonuclease TnpB [Bacilli bacterium]